MKKQITSEFILKSMRNNGVPELIAQRASARDVRMMYSCSGTEAIKVIEALTYAADIKRFILKD
jgi:hypothetical protein